MLRKINMNNEKQQIAIAEACGLPKPYSRWSGADGDTLCHSVTVEDGLKRAKPIPDYLNDLNAMHEAEKVLGADDKKKFASRLFDIVLFQREGLDQLDGWYLHVHSTAKQRAEAFLRTIGKWENDERLRNYEQCSLSA